MNGSLKHPGLPETPVTLALVSGEYAAFAQELHRLGVQTVETEAEDRLPSPVRYHPDLQVCILNKEHMFVPRQNPLRSRLAQWGIEALETEREPQCRYPGDVLCGSFTWNGYWIGNPRGTDPAILRAAREMGLQPLAVRQGYANCSVALVNGRAAITTDPGLAGSLEEYGFEILRIRPGFIQLPGYDTGFIGGCCGKLAADLMAFTGSLSQHPDGGCIRSFLRYHAVSVLELSSQPLLDVGGIVPLRQKINSSETLFGKEE